MGCGTSTPVVDASNQNVQVMAHRSQSQSHKEYVAMPNQAGTNIEDPDTAKSGVFYHVSVSIWMAKGLIEADSLGGSDPYVIAECQGVKLRTETVQSNTNPVFNERFDFMLKSKPSYITFALMDSDLATSDDPLGQCYIALDASHCSEQGHPVQWLDVNSTPEMKQQGVEATGQLQVQANCTEVRASAEDAETQARMRQVLSLGVHSLLLTSVQFKPEQAAKALRCARGGELLLVFIVQFGQHTVRSPAIPVDQALVEIGTPIPIHKQARFWVLAGQENYVARVYIYADTNRKAGADPDLELLSIANVPTKRLLEGVTADRASKKKSIDEGAEDKPAAGKGKGKGKGGKIAESATQHMSVGFLAAALSDEDGDGALGDNQLRAALIARPKLHVQGPGQALRREQTQAAQLRKAHTQERKALRRQAATRHVLPEGTDESAKSAQGEADLRGTVVAGGKGTFSKVLGEQEVAPALRDELLGVKMVQGGVDEKIQAGAGASGAGGAASGAGVDRDVGSGGVHTLIRPSAKDAAAAMAIVGVRGVFSSKVDLERVFFSRLLERFDGDKDGRLEKEEILMGLSALSHGDINKGLGMDDKGIEELFDRLDADGSGALEESELLRFLRSAEFQSSRMAATMMAYVLDGQGGVQEMMTGFKDPDARRVGQLQAVRGGGKILAGAEELDTVGELYGMERRTGMVVKEHIPGYVRMALNMLYKAGDLAKLSGVRAALSQFSAHEGAEKNEPSSVDGIADFIAQFGIDEREMQLPVEAFGSFNEFFYRKLKKEARPIAAPEDDSVLVSPADCRLNVFNTITDATRLWIKGKQFSVDQLFGTGADEVKRKYAPRFQGGSLVIARLAPQDYHRWHFPVSGTLSPRMPVDGCLYTVNPIAIKKELDVYTENKRLLHFVDTEDFGTVGMVAVGATVVGSIHITVEDGSKVRKGDEHGYFAFGGSTVLLLFEPGRVRFDADLLENSYERGLETIVKVGDRIGQAVPPGVADGGREAEGAAAGGAAAAAAAGGEEEGT